MFCPQCGHELLDGARFCVNCGFAIASNVAKRTDDCNRKSTVHGKDANEEAAKYNIAVRRYKTGIAALWVGEIIGAVILFTISSTQDILSKLFLSVLIPVVATCFMGYQTYLYVKDIKQINGKLICNEKKLNFDPFYRNRLLTLVPSLIYILALIYVASRVT